MALYDLSSTLKTLTDSSELFLPTHTDPYSQWLLENPNPKEFMPIQPLPTTPPRTDIATPKQIPKAPAPTSGSGGGSGGGSGSGGGGGAGGNLSGISSATQPSYDWAKAILSGDFSNLPMYNEMTDPKYSDPTQNPYIQAMIDNLQREMQEDWFGEATALNEMAEAGGRYGSGTYLHARGRLDEETQEALASEIARMYSGAYENERQRRAGLMGQFLGAQTSASRIPIELGNLGVSQGMLGVSQGQLGLDRERFAFEKKMGLLGAQQDSINDYLNILLGIGGIGQTGSVTRPGVYQGSVNPFVAGGLGFASGAVDYWSGPS